MTDQTAFDLDTVLPAWEANYEPGNVSDYLIGYANDETAAKGAAIAWLTSQSDKNPATLEWVEMPTGDQHDHWFNLIQNAEDGMALDIGINVRHRLPATVRDAARTASGQQPETCRPIDVDGTTVLVRGSDTWTDEDQHHMAAIVAAAKRRYEAEHPACACTHPQDRHLSACTECPCIGYASTWPPQTTGSEGPDPCSACPTFPCRKCAPAVGQPAEAQAADLLAACATEYQVPVPEGGGTTLQVRRQSLVHGMGWAVSTRAYGGGRAWTTEGWQESISALSVDRLFCWPDAATAVTEARRALATVEEDETR